MNRRYSILFGSMILLVLGCTKPYMPKAVTSINSYLVVEGIINTNLNDTTAINLSRTVNLSSAVSSIPETGAVISIQDNQNQSYNLTEIGKGVYKSAALTLDNTRQYRISIHTTDGKNYLSDYQPAVLAPAIDSIGFALKTSGPNIGMQIYVNTHDPKNNTHYYRWDYIETWEFTARYQTQYISNGVDDVVPRTLAQKNIYQCWNNGLSNDILLGSSAKLSQDVIYQQPITFIPSTSEKIELRYSILLKQYALTEDAYNYFSQLKKNTEELGSIFDAQPTQLTGNVHCITDATLPVIGYITAGIIQQKRIYVNNSQLPITWIAQYPYLCDLDTAWYVAPHTGFNQVLQILVPLPNTEIPVSAIIDPKNPSPKPAGYLYSNIDCVDCTVRGTTTPPSFWIQ